MLRVGNGDALVRKRWMFSLCILVLSCEVAAQVRVPAEWEAHAATWMQWPGRWERAMRPAFADIIDVIQGYEPVHLLTSSQSELDSATQFLTTHGVPDTNITWHIIPVDSAWMRDNGPVYVTDGTKMWVQNWKFDAWGGNFGADISGDNDNLVPRPRCLHARGQFTLERRWRDPLCDQ